jgi:hypothetical protein
MDGLDGFEVFDGLDRLRGLNGLYKLDRLHSFERLDILDEWMDGWIRTDNKPLSVLSVLANCPKICSMRR